MSLVVVSLKVAVVNDAPRLLGFRFFSLACSALYARQAAWRWWAWIASVSSLLSRSDRTPVAKPPSMWEFQQIKEPLRMRKPYITLTHYPNGHIYPGCKQCKFNP
jgi:hypothetical protein